MITAIAQRTLPTNAGGPVRFRFARLVRIPQYTEFRTSLQNHFGKKYTMTDIEIDRRLALAIGYPADRVRVASFWHKGNYKKHVQVLNDNSRMDGPMQYSGWRLFDHTNPAVIWPIAERYECFPSKGIYENSLWFCDWQKVGHAKAVTASALGVIKYVEGQK